MEQARQARSARREEGVRQGGRATGIEAASKTAATGQTPDPTNPGRAGYIVVKISLGNKRGSKGPMWFRRIGACSGASPTARNGTTRRDAGWEPCRGRCDLVHTSKGKRTPGRHVASGKPLKSDSRRRRAARWGARKNGVQAQSPKRRCPARTTDEKPQAPGVAAKVAEEGPNPIRSYVDGDIVLSA